MDIESFNIGDLQCYRDWDCEGEIRMRNPKTIDKYLKIKHGQFDFEKHGIFFAFDVEQFKKEKERMIRKGYIKKNNKIFSLGAGAYGNIDGVKSFHLFCDNKNELITKECDPQEVYIYEWNNHECMFGDEETAYNLIESIFGKERAEKITRF